MTKNDSFMSWFIILLEKVTDNWFVFSLATSPNPSCLCLFLSHICLIVNSIALACDYDM